RRASGHRRLRGVEDTLAQQVEVRPAIHLPLEQLEAVHLAFGLAVAVRLGAGGLDGCFILAQLERKAAQLGGAAGQGIGDPGRAGPAPRRSRNSSRKRRLNSTARATSGSSLIRWSSACCSTALHSAGRRTTSMAAPCGRK